MPASPYLVSTSPLTVPPGCGCCPDTPPSPCCNWCNTTKYCVHFDDATSYMDGLPSGPYTGTNVDLVYTAGATLAPPLVVYCEDGTSIKQVGGYWWNESTVPNLSVDFFTNSTGCYALVELDITDPVSVISRYRLNFGTITSYITGYTTCQNITFTIPCETFPSRPPIVITLTPGACGAVTLSAPMFAAASTPPPPCVYLAEDPLTMREGLRLELSVVRRWRQCSKGYGVKGTDGNGYICGCAPWPDGGCGGCPSYIASQ